MTTDSSGAGTDLLVFGPHPDDIEIGMGATVARHAARGLRVALCDLTRGELGSNGTPETRIVEADDAARVLGAAARENLGLPDGGLSPDAPAQIRAVVECLRRFRPRAVALPYWQDRHPDHVRGSELLTRAVFSSGLRRWPADGAAWRPAFVCYYFINDAAPASFVVDATPFYELKRRALACHRSQFEPVDPDRADTRLTSPLFVQLVESRDAQFGAIAGVRFAEGFVVRQPLVRDDLLPTPPPGPAPAPEAP